MACSVRMRMWTTLMATVVMAVLISSSTGWAAENNDRRENSRLTVKKDQKAKQSRQQTKSSSTHKKQAQSNKSRGTAKKANQRANRPVRRAVTSKPKTQANARHRPRNENRSVHQNDSRRKQQVVKQSSHKDKKKKQEFKANSHNANIQVHNNSPGRSRPVVSHENYGEKNFEGRHRENWRSQFKDQRHRLPSCGHAACRGQTTCQYVNKTVVKCKPTYPNRKPIVCKTPRKYDSAPVRQCSCGRSTCNICVQVRKSHSSWYFKWNWNYPYRKPTVCCSAYPRCSCHRPVYGCVSPRYSYGLPATREIYVDRYDAQPNIGLSAVDQGWECLRIGDAREARRAFARAINSDPDAGLPHIGYALTAALTGRENEAIREMREALRIDPYSLESVPLDEEVRESVVEVLSIYQQRVVKTSANNGDWFMIAALQYLLQDYTLGYFAIDSAIARGDRDESAVNLKLMTRDALDEAVNETFYDEID